MTDTEKYLGWLIDFVESPELDRGHHSYLYTQLLRTEFTWVDDKTNDLYMDENRADDGLYLRQDYCDSFNVDRSELEQDLDVHNKCSILEMMVAFAKRIDDEVMWDNEYGDRTPIWFGYMIYALRLDTYKDGSKYSWLGVKRKLNKFLRRDYGLDGYGGLFYIEVDDWRDVDEHFDYISHFRPDMNRTELWQQMGIWTQLYSDGIIIRHRKIENLNG